MPSLTLELLNAQLQCAEELDAGREFMFEPQDLPGRYGRVVKALDHILQAVGCQAVVGGGWAVWRHGYLGRVTRDIDIVLPADQVDEFLQAASVSGFEVLAVPVERWPKLLHRDTQVDVDILPEGRRPGTPSRPAPTTIPHPARLGASGSTLTYASLPALIEMKLAAGRTQDRADVVKLIQANPDQIDTIREHLRGIHPDYVFEFNRLEQQAREEADGVS